MGGARARGAVASLILVSLLAVGAPQAAPADDWTFVQVQRANSLQLQFGTDTYATQNAFGGAFESVAQTPIQSSIDQAVADGSITWLLEMPGLTDLSGTNNSAFEVGVLGGTPVQAAGNPATYDGNSDLDWWYLPNPVDLASDGSPTNKLNATFTAKTFEAGPGRVALNVNFGGASVPLAMSNTQIQAVASNSSTPLTSTNGFPPGHEPAEHLPNSLTSFESMSAGKLIGRISAGSLASAAIPAGLVGGSCFESYTSANTMLDLIVGGCHPGGFITAVTPTQPDTFDPAAGSGSYTFSADVNKHVTGCRHNAVAAVLSDCLAQAAYSSYFKFTTDRVIDRSQVSIRRQLTVNKTGPGSGAVTSSPAGVDCGDDCTGLFGAGTQVTLTAIPSSGSRLEGWTGCDNPSGATCVMTMDADKPVTASFVPETGSPAGGGGSGDGGGATPPGASPNTSAADRTPPAFGSASISPRKVRKRATVKFSLSEAAQVTFVFERVTSGRRVGAKCVKKTRGNARKRRCDRFAPAARMTAIARAGANQKAVATRIGKRTLKPGPYRLTLRASDAVGNKSQPKRLTFVVLRPRRG